MPCYTMKMKYIVDLWPSDSLSHGVIHIGLSSYKSTHWLFWTMFLQDCGYMTSILTLSHECLLLVGWGFPSLSKVSHITRQLFPGMNGSLCVCMCMCVCVCVCVCKYMCVCIVGVCVCVFWACVCFHYILLMGWDWECIVPFPLFFFASWRGGND